MVLFFLSVQAACTTTQFKSVWKEETFDGPLNNILVVGVAERNDIRRFFEKEFAKLFNDRGTKAMASTVIIPSEKELNEDYFLFLLPESLHKS